MVIFEIVITLMMVSWLINKMATNQNPDMNEAQEAERNKSAAEHQMWQTADLTEPWGKL